MDADENLYLVDLQTDTIKPLNVRGRIAGWSPDGCTLYLSQHDGLYAVHWATSQNSKLAAADELYLDTVSPDGAWLAQFVGTGLQLYSGYEFQDVRVTSLIGAGGPYTVTQRGGAQAAIWSADSSWLVYTDFDTQGVGQIYRAAPDGSGRQQLTAFDEAGTRVLYVEVSPDNAHLAAYVVNDAADTTEIVVVDVGSGGVLDSFADLNGLVWWQDNDVLVLSRRSTDDGYSFIWYDTAARILLAELAEVDLRLDEGMYYVGPLDGNRIAFFASRTFFAYDPETQELKALFQQFTDIPLEKFPWKILPAGFAGEEACQPLRP